MSLAQLTKKQANRVVGIDCSTKSLAYAVFEDDKPVTCGEVFFEGRDVYQRLNDAREKTQILVDLGILVGDYVAMEAAVFVNSQDVLIKLSYVYGAILSVLMQNNMEVVTTRPLEWQNAIGNPTFKKAEKDKFKSEYPDHKTSWYSNEIRKIRKQRTLDKARQWFEIKSNSDNVGDAVGIAWYASTVLTKR